MKKFQTKKLFYDTYPYKLVVRNGISAIFRDKNLSRAKHELDHLQRLYEAGESLRRPTVIINPVKHETFFEAKKIYKFLSENHNDFKLRIENPTLIIYSKDVSWLKTLSTELKNCIEFWEPSNNLDLEPYTIYVDYEPEYHYKITLGERTDPNLANWIRKNSDKVKAGDICLSTIESGGFTRNMYILARDQKIINLLNLFDLRIVRIDKLVHSI